MSKGHVYVLTNSAAPGVVKVGRTNNLQRRVNQHNSQSSTVGRWKLYWSLEVPDDQKAEDMALKALRALEVSGRKEQFKIDADQAVRKVSIALAEWSDWGRREKERLDREAEAARLKREAEAREQREKEKRLEAARERNRLRLAYPERKAEYDRDVKIASGEEPAKYPWGFGDAYVAALVWAVFGLFEPQTAEIAKPVLGSFLIGGWIWFLTLWFPKFTDWRDQKQHAAARIETFNETYPDGEPL